MPTKHINKNSTYKGIRFPHDLIELIDAQAKKENTNFSAWVIDACRQKLVKRK